MLLSDYYQKIGERDLSLNSTEIVYRNIPVLRGIIKKHSANPEFNSFLINTDYKFKVASWLLATQCTAARRDGIDNINIFSIDKKHCNKLDEYGFVESNWCEPYSTSLYEKQCTEI